VNFHGTYSCESSIRKHFPNPKYGIYLIKTTKCAHYWLWLGVGIWNLPDLESEVWNFGLVSSAFVTWNFRTLPSSPIIKSAGL
jgi:hypothetical protein